MTGKIQVEMLLAARKAQTGDGLGLNQFKDSFDAAGLIAVSLMLWELTSQMPNDVARVLAPARN